MIFIFGNMAARFYAFLDDDDDFTSDALKIISSTSFLTFYFIFVPLFLWGLIKLTGSGRDDPEYFFLVSVYGYSFVPFLPAIVMYLIPSHTLKWAVLLMAGGISLVFLAKEMFGKVAQCLEGTHVKIASVVMLVMHLIFILTLKWKFL